MAAIVPVTQVVNGFYPSIRDVAAQATTGQTDWLVVPAWARFVVVFFNLTANAGTTPISTPSFLAVPEGVFDDADTVTLFTGAAITAASQHRYSTGPGVTGIADGTDSATVDASVGVNTLLPALLGVKILNDRTTADETYTYKLSARFLSGK